MRRERRVRIWAALISGALAGCQASPRPGLLLVGQMATLPRPVPYTEVETEGRHYAAVTFNEGDIKHIKPDPGAALQGAAGGALLGAVLGSGLGAVTGNLAAMTEHGGSRYVIARGDGKVWPAPDPKRADEFYSKLRAGQVPVNFFRSFEPPVSIRVLLFSVPAAAVLYIRGAPTKFATTADLYLSPEDIQASTLELTGYAPCQVPSAIVPGLQQPDGQEALTVRCTLVALASEQPPKQMPKRGR